MDRALKQRLIGAIVLVLAGVIFIPLLLDGAGHNARFSRDFEIPAEPDIKIKSWDELKEIPANSRPAKVAIKSENSGAEKPLNKTSVAKPEPGSKSKADQKAAVKAWVLQLGSFGQQTNALVLQDRLRAKGYRAFIVETKSFGGSRYKVRIGPDLDRAKAEEIAKQLKKKENIDSIVMGHP
ncbi:MAG: SPOR domain-containing protein [Gammaproteobacteria bacterium]|nr:SPOR domain-containing protein [Gammaproteobacteria bacterium]